MHLIPASGRIRPESSNQTKTGPYHPAEPRTEPGLEVGRRSELYQTIIQTGQISGAQPKGVDAPKPLHELRKEFRALINEKYGIYAASRALRHSDVAITVAHYADKKARVTVGLGAVLGKLPEFTRPMIHTPATRLLFNDPVV